MNDLTDYIKKAFEYKNNGEYKKAIDYFYKALAVDNESVEIMNELACLYSKIFQFNRAISFYEQILLKNPKNNEVKYSFAILLKKLKEYRKAEAKLVELYNENYEIQSVCEELFSIFELNEKYEQIISFYKQRMNILKSSSIYYYVGNAYEKTGDINLSREFYEKAYMADENNLLAAVNYAWCLHDKGLINDAENLALKILKSFEDDKLYYLLAEINYCRDKYDVALKYYSYAIKLNMKNAVYYFKIGLIFSLKGFFNEAEESYCKAIELEPKDITYNYALAYLYYVNKKYDLALKLIEYILYIDNDNTMALSLNVLLLIAKNEAPSADKFVEILCSQSSDNDFKYYAIAMYYEKLNMWEKVIVFITKAISLNDDFIDYKYELAKCYYNLSSYKESQKIIKDILAVNNKYIQGYILLAKLLLKQKKYSEATNEVDKALKLDINSFEANFVKGWIYLEQNEFEKAEKYFKIAVSINPNSEESYKCIADCYYHLEKYEDAYLYYKEAANIDITNAEYRYYMAKCSIKMDDKENALSSFSIMKRLEPYNINYIEEYVQYLVKCGNEKNAQVILKSMLKQLNNSEEQLKIKEILEKIKNKC